MLQICSNGWSEKVNKCPWRGNKRMWFLINLKEEQQGDLVNPSFICCLRPLVCLLHNVVFSRGGRMEGWRGRMGGSRCTPSFQMKCQQIKQRRRKRTGVPPPPGFYCSLSSVAPTHPPPNLRLPPPPPALLLVRGFICSISALKITKRRGNN